MKKYNHPAMFSEELAKRVLQIFSFKNDIILDSFSRAEATCFVAKKTDRRYPGVDILKEYYKTARARIKG